ncbi:MAG: GNAT family N-acetyltransferase [Providencia heimbachae]|nr:MULTISPECIES: GNAT family N-acetyltransferase [Providencia]MBP6122726.1 GNAT family N-acetyltransferase [Providencia sp.]MDD9341720.1 GNAT family N-acetyltransferase [Providencia heimbachae]
MNIKFRLATHQDINQLNDIDTVGTTERYQEIALWITQHNCYLIEQNDEILAYGVFHYHFFAQGFIELLMVARQHRRQGLGLVLITNFKSLCKTPKLFTSTNQSNRLTQQLFQRAGFIRSGFIENLDDADPELIYCQLLK